MYIKVIKNEESSDLIIGFRKIGDGFVMDVNRSGVISVVMVKSKMFVI